jgi:hypothetical protein
MSTRWQCDFFGCSALAVTIYPVATEKLFLCPRHGEWLIKIRNSTSMTPDDATDIKRVMRAAEIRTFYTT